MRRWSAGNVYLLPPTVKLGEAKVQASKILMVMKGDTLVYNADVLRMAAGTMLENLISELPGVQLDPHGQIFVNGRKVESLLLNGEDFFRGDNTVMLENLPAYMVKDVKVYDKDGRLSEFMGRKAGDEELVMDVRLKREYSVGWLGRKEKPPDMISSSDLMEVKKEKRTGPMQTTAISRQSRKATNLAWFFLNAFFILRTLL